MARKFIYICDGCDLEITTGSDRNPSGWADVRIGLEGLSNWLSGGNSSPVFHVILCAHCQLIVAEQANPKAWPRTKKEMG